MGFSVIFVIFRDFLREVYEIFRPDVPLGFTVIEVLTQGIDTYLTELFLVDPSHVSAQLFEVSERFFLDTTFVAQVVEQSCVKGKMKIVIERER